MHVLLQINFKLVYRISLINTDKRQYFDLNIAFKFHEFGHTISQKLCLKVPVSEFFLSRYPYSIRDLILNKRTSKDARLMTR